MISGYSIDSSWVSACLIDYSWRILASITINLIIFPLVGRWRNSIIVCVSISWWYVSCQFCSKSLYLSPWGCLISHYFRWVVASIWLSGRSYRCVGTEFPPDGLSGRFCRIRINFFTIHDNPIDLNPLISLKIEIRVDDCSFGSLWTCICLISSRCISFNASAWVIRIIICLII